MRLLKRLLVGLIALLMLAMLSVYLTPLNVYIPEMERTLGARLQVQVRIGSLSAAMLPLPHLELHDVIIGGQDGIALSSVDVSPALPDLLAGRLAMHVKVHDGAAHLAQLIGLTDALSRAPVVGHGPIVRELQLSELILLTPEFAIGPLEGKLEFAETGVLQRVWLALDEQKLTALLSPLPDRRFAVEVQAKGWVPQLSRLAKFQVDELHLNGVVGPGKLVAQRFSVVSQGLVVEGSARLGFSDGWNIRVKLGRAEVPLDRLVTLLGKPVVLTGLLSARGDFNSRSNSWDGLMEKSHFIGDFHLTDVSAQISESFRQPLVVDAVQSHVVLDPAQLELSELQAAMYGGSLSGDLRIDRKKSVLDARLSASDIKMRSLVEALTNEVLFTGRMEGQTRLSMNLDRLDRIPQNLKLAGKFHLRDGTVSKVDLAQVASNSNATGPRGGVTRFSNLTGSLRADASGYHFSELKMSSGSLDADGRIDVTPALALNGALDVDMKGTAGIVSMPLVIAGTLEHPEVRVSSAAWAGAAVGTAVLGPGLGTALGVRLGGFMNKLFGTQVGIVQRTPRTHVTR